MSKPDYWPKDKSFRPIQCFSPHRISATLATEDDARYNSPMELEGVSRPWTPPSRSWRVRPKRPPP